MCHNSMGSYVQVQVLSLVTVLPKAKTLAMSKQGNQPHVK